MKRSAICGHISRPSDSVKKAENESPTPFLRRRESGFSGTYRTSAALSLLPASRLHHAGRSFRREAGESGMENPSDTLRVLFIFFAMPDSTFGFMEAAYLGMGAIATQSHHIGVKVFRIFGCFRYILTGVQRPGTVEFLTTQNRPIMAGDVGALGGTIARRTKALRPCSHRC
jgi:hypothetical protein